MNLMCKLIGHNYQVKWVNEPMEDLGDYVGEQHGICQRCNFCLNCGRCYHK